MSSPCTARAHTLTMGDDHSTRADLTSWSVAELARAMRSRRVGVVEVVRAHLARGEQHVALNAFVSRRTAELLADAERAQQAIDTGEPLGPLHGVPFSAKDILATAGVRTTLGSAVLAHTLPRHDATAIARLRAAGALLLGKTNCPELGFGVTCESPVIGATASPYGACFSPGGSSGGEAVAVATGSSAFGVGTDFGGSVRWPAQCTGIIGLRPTPGRVPGTGQLPGAGGSLATEGPALVNPATMQGTLQVVGLLARRVADIALVLSCLSGPDGLDPSAAPLAAPPACPGPISHLRIAWSDGAAIGPVRREVAAGCRAAALALESEVAAVEEIPNALTGAYEAFNELRALEQLADQRIALGDGAVHSSDFVRTTLADVPTPDPIAEAHARRRAGRARVDALASFAGFDVLLLPVAGGPACAPDGTLEVDGTQLEGWQLMAHCRAVSLLGAPALAVPVARSAEGLPLSVQVVGHPWAESAVLAVAAALEQIFSEEIQRQ